MKIKQLDSLAPEASTTTGNERALDALRARKGAAGCAEL